MSSASGSASSARLVLPLGLAGMLAASGALSSLEAQIALRDLVITGGVSLEGYQGNLPAASVTVVDSAEQAAAAVGEVALRGEVDLVNGAQTRLSLAFDGGLRQFAASGFEFRDYAPRESVGTLELSYGRRMGTWGALMASTRLKGRAVHDRPPMPLYIQPAYRSASAALGFESRPLGDFLGGVRLRAEVAGELADFRALEFAPQLALLDREVGGIEIGAEWGRGSSAYRVYTAVDGARHPSQFTLDPDDPYRRDRTIQTGVRWTRDGPVYLQMGLEGTANRSNSRRPEYNALSLNTIISTELPADLGLGIYTALTAKRYVHPTEFARLIPGEEADNASVAYFSLSRRLASNLDGTLRLGWTRAETEIGDNYFQRYGTTVLLHYRPGF